MSAFGQPQTGQPQASSGLFGSSTPSTGLGSITQATSTTSLFGSQNQPTASSGGLFGAPQSTNTASQSTSNGLFGSSAQAGQPGGSLFGQNPSFNAGGFGSTAATPSMGQAPAGSTVSNSTSSTGGLFGSSTPNQASSSSGTTGLFGTTATTGTSSSLFGTNTSGTSGATGGLFGTPGTSGAQSQAGGTAGGATLFGGTTAQPATSTGLFGTSSSATPTQPGGSGLFGSTSAPTPSQPVSTGLFGSTGTNAGATGTTSLFGTSSSSVTTGTSGPTAGTGGLFGTLTAAPPTSQTSSSIFGNSATPSAGAGTAQGIQGSASLAQAKANLLEHRPIEEVLATWETRISHQASIFQKFAGDVVSVDKQLIQSARRLKELSDEHSVIKQKSAHIDSAIKSIWDHQDALGKLLSHIQDELNRDRTTAPMQYSGAALSGTGSASERGAALWSQILDMETEINDIVRDIESISSGKVHSDESAQGNLSSLMKLIKLHAHSIATLQQQTNDTRKTLQGL